MATSSTSVHATTKTTSSAVQRIEASIQAPEELNLDQRSKYEEFRKKKIENDCTRDYYTLRKGWSIFIAIVLLLSIAFQVVITILVGKKILDFSNNQILINSIMGENFLQIIGLVYVIINFLYPKNER